MKISTETIEISALLAPLQTHLMLRGSAMKLSSEINERKILPRQNSVQNLITQNRQRKEARKLLLTWRAKRTIISLKLILIVMRRVVHRFYPFRLVPCRWHQSQPTTDSLCLSLPPLPLLFHAQKGIEKSSSSRPVASEMVAYLLAITIHKAVALKTTHQPDELARRKFFDRLFFFLGLAATLFRPFAGKRRSTSVYAPKPVQTFNVFEFGNSFGASRWW